MVGSRCNAGQLAGRVIVYAIVQEHGVGGLTIATLMAGFIIIGMGLAKLGNYLKFIPYPLIVGFTSGIAIIIFSSQIKDLFGLPIDSLPADFVEKWKAYAENLRPLTETPLPFGLSTILISLKFYRINKIPVHIVAIC
ncbi:MAG: SulP family inorganic anion transporter [Flavobacteriaceae bacterium]|nr:SulP family inorganic anion transporter [Flavobacteriaceae bacterium]